MSGQDARPTYVPVAMPERFILEFRSDAGGWLDWGLYAATDFRQLEDGSYTTDHSNGSPMRLRCVQQRGDEIDVVVGDGQRDVYRIVAFPSERYPG